LREFNFSDGRYFLFFAGTNFGIVKDWFFVLDIKFCYFQKAAFAATPALYHQQFHRFIERDVLNKWHQQVSACEACLYNFDNGVKSWKKMQLENRKN